MYLVLLIVIVIVYFCIRHPDTFTQPGHAMVIVEPRAHRDLRRVIANFDAIMPLSYTLYLFHGRSHTQHAEQAVQGLRRPCALIALHTDNLNAAQYNALLTSAAFWHQVKAEHILVFQTDAALCAKSPFVPDDFLAFDYVGCPYDAHTVGPDTHWGAHAFYGVGGLSFRKRSAMLSCISRGIPPGTPEDVAFSDCISRSGGPLPDAATLNKLCTQESHHQPSFGAHQIRRLSERDAARFQDHCPESAFLHA